MALLLLLALSSGARQSAAQSRDITVRPDASPAGGAVYANSWALVVGINAYQKVTPRLNYAVADAKAIADALPGLGFPPQNIRVLVDGDATKARIEMALYEDFRAMGPEDRLLVFFAGHGESVPIKGGEEGYLLPVDTNPSALPRTAIPMDDVRRIGRRVKAKHVLFVLDACFSGFGMTRDIVPSVMTDAYLAVALREPVVQVLTAGRKGERAIEEGGHGLFTRRLLDGLRGLADPDGRGILTAAQLAAWIEPRVVRDSKGKMTPQYGRLEGEGQFVFVRPGALVARAQPPPEAPRPKVAEEIRQEMGSLAVSAGLAGIEVWLGDQKIGETRPGRALVVSDLPVGAYRLKAVKGGYGPWERAVQVAANTRVEVKIQLDARPVVASLPPAPRTPAPGSAFRRLGTDNASMVFVPGGPFLMGAGDDDPRASSVEKPQRTITLGGFWIDQLEVTNAQYRLFRGATRHRAPSLTRDPRFNGPSQPVVGVSWEDAQTYCRWVGKRLPTEAEWEKAARGTDGRVFPWGTVLADASGLVHVGQAKTGDVGTYPTGASPYGVYDMAGNVWEWVHDWYDPNFYGKDSTLANPSGPAVGGEKVLRGGSWWERDLSSVRVTARHHQPPERTHNNVGFRCALSGTADLGR